MAATIAERVGSRLHSGDNLNRQVELLYVIQGEDDDIAVRALVASTAPATYDGLVRSDISISPEYADTSTSKGCWYASVTYITEDKFESQNTPIPPKQKPITNGDTVISFDISGNQVTTLKSLEPSQIKSFWSTDAGLWSPVPTVAKDFKGLIGVNSDGRVDGAQVYTPSFTLQITKGYNKSLVTTAKMITWMNATGKTNSIAFDGNGELDSNFQAGEVLYLGVTGSTREPIAELSETQPVYVLTHTFAINPNGSIDTILGINWNGAEAKTKLGWDYLWFYYEQAQVEPEVVAVPKFAYVEKLYNTTDLNAVI